MVNIDCQLDRAWKDPEDAAGGISGREFVDWIY